MAYAGHVPSVCSSRRKSLNQKSLLSGATMGNWIEMKTGASGGMDEVGVSLLLIKDNNEKLQPQTGSFWNISWKNQVTNVREKIQRNRKQAHKSQQQNYSCQPQAQSIAVIQ